METISRHMKNRTVSDQGKSCLTNPITFYNEMNDLVDKWIAVNVVYLDFINTFNILSHQILTEKLMKYGLEEQTVRWNKT